MRQKICIPHALSARTARRANEKPRLLVFIEGLVQLENMGSIASSLVKRGQVDVKLLASTTALMRDRRFLSFLKRNAIPFKIVKKQRYWRNPAPYLEDVDAVLTISDPVKDLPLTRGFSEYYAKVGMETIYLQHGLVQYNLNYPLKGRDLRFHSGLILLWQDPQEQGILAPEYREKASIVGFTKNPVLPVKDLSLRSRWLRSKYRSVVVFCHSFILTEMFNEDDIETFYRIATEYAERNPKDLVILRGHRMRMRVVHRDRDRSLCKRLPNVVVSSKHFGAFSGLAFADLLAHVDAVVSTPSTALLDATYAGVPVAKIGDHPAVLESLPTITCAEDVEAVRDSSRSAALPMVMPEFGELETNIQHACDAIEAHMMSLRARGK